MNRLCPFKWFVLQNFPFIEEDFDAITNYQLLCKVIEYLNKTIDKTNELGEQVEALNNWFNNLDVQEEINNKLDEMAEGGELAEIIAQYINLHGVLAFNTVTNMKSAENLVANSIVKTLGYYQIGDNGASYYKIREVINTDTIDEMTLISLINYPTLVAEFILTDDKINPAQFGAKYDEITDDSDIIQKTINYAYENHIEYVGTMKYSLISKTILIPSPISIKHLYLKASSTITNFISGYMIFVNTEDGINWVDDYNSFCDNILNDVQLINPNTSNNLHGIKCIANVQIENVYARSLNKVIDCDSTSPKYIDTILIKNVQISGKIGNEYSIIIPFLGDCFELKNTHIYDTIGSNYLLDVGDARNPSTISNIINGKINIAGGTFSLSNIHLEGNDANINLSKGNYSLDTIYITGFEKPSIVLNNAKVNINNFISVYNLSRSYESDIDISLSNGSICNINNSYKKAIASNQSASSLIRSPLKTNVNDYTFTNQEISTNYRDYFVNTKNITLNASYTADGIGNTSYGSWKKPAGTYYYLLAPLYDPVRLISTNYEGSFNITKTNDTMTVTQIYGVVNNIPIRILRGTIPNTYTEYVDIIAYDSTINDNGNICNGKLWTTLDTAVSGSFGSNYYNNLSYKGINAICSRNSAPSSGTWTAGDIIYNTNIAAGNDIGWICTTSGTPGTWISMGKYPS